MTIPSRPAPAPPGQRGLHAVAGANASLEQLRQQLHQQQQRQQQNGGVQLLTIKLPPPPPKCRSSNGATPPLGNSLFQKNNNKNNISNNNSNNNPNGSSITRKFPQANVRYAPATSWDGSPFDSSVAAASTNTALRSGNSKKIPPPRPPPPKVSAHKKSNAPAPPPSQSVNILNNIFNRKKSTRAPPAPHNKSGRLTPSAVYGATATSSAAASHSSSSYMTTTNGFTQGSSNCNNWNSSSVSTASFSTHTSGTSNARQVNPQQEAQLISFESPPSSPTFTQKSNSDCVSVDSFSSDSNFSSPNNGSGSQPESGFEDDFSARSRSATSPLDPWETVDAFSGNGDGNTSFAPAASTTIGTAAVRNLSSVNTRLHSSSDNPLCNGKSLLPPAPSLAKPTIIKPKVSQKPKAPKPPAISNNLFSGNSVYAASEIDSTPPSPPMPHCAPPPPPAVDACVVSLLDVISGKVDALQLAKGVGNDFEATETPYGVALYNFDGVEDGDLSLRENEKIYLVKQVNEEWFYGRNRSGWEGIFPVNYIDVRVPLRSSSVASEASIADNSSSYCFTMKATATHYTKNTTSRSQISKVKCLYNFPAEVEGDLSLRENDLVTILYKINDDWLVGEVDGKQGQFPANFLEYVPDNTPMLSDFPL